MQRFLVYALFLALIATACSSAGSEATTKTDDKAETVIYLSRHAEKADGKDPGLLPAGAERAERLATHLSDQKIAAVYATGYNRTQATATPTARMAGVSVKTYPAADSAAKLTKQWLKKHRGQTIFVVGHSNTVPGLVNALVSSASYSDIDEDDYGNLFRVVVDGEGKGSVQEVGY